MPYSRGVACLAGFAVLVATGGARIALDARQAAPAAPRGAAPLAPHVALLNSPCLDCHDNNAKEAGLSLEAIATDDVAKHADVWEKVVRKLRTRQMPPMGEPRPDEATYNRVVSYLETTLDRAAAAHPNPGRTATIRRLTRTEYQNAIRDLLALDVDVPTAGRRGELGPQRDVERPPMLLFELSARARRSAGCADDRQIAGGETFACRRPDAGRADRRLPIGTRRRRRAPRSRPTASMRFRSGCGATATKRSRA
jgi:hypothetical protein